MCDAAIKLLADDGVRGVSHRRVDRTLEVPDGTTSYNFRSTSALVYATADRLTELDLADLRDILRQTGSTAQGGGASPLAAAVFAAMSEPGATRTRARYELLLMATRDPALDRIMRHSVDLFTELTRLVVRQFEGSERVGADDSGADHRHFVLMTFLNGLMLGFVRGDRTVSSPEQIDQLIRSVIRNI